jgi:isopenicillin-N epimerase
MTSPLAASKHTFGRAMLAHWPLDPAITYLNHGTVGVVPKRVTLAQRAIAEELERQPARFLLRELADVGPWPTSRPPRMRVAAAEVAAFVGVGPDDLVFVENTTTGCNAVLGSFPFAAGDEILLTDHGYGAIGNAARHAASRSGAVVRTMELPFPGTTPQAVTAAVEAALTDRTRLLVVDHLCSVSALVLPVREIAAACRARGVATLVDGAHVPGMLPLDIPSLGADFYTGNLHKWAMTARPLGLLWAAPERRAGLHPTVISWGYGKGLAAEFDLLGTRDPSAALSAPAALEFMRELGLEAMRDWNHRVAWAAARALTRHWGTAIPAPETMYGSMVTIPLPGRVDPDPLAVETLRTALLFEDRIEAQLLSFRGRAWLRLAAQVYNEPADFERLRDAIDRRAPAR